MNQNQSTLKLSMHNGAIIGGIYCAIILLFYVSGSIHTEGDLSQYLNAAAFVGATYWYIKRYRISMNNELSFRDGFFYGMQLGFFSSVIFGVFLYVLYTFDPGLLSQYFILMEEQTREASKAFQALGWEMGVDQLVDELDKLKTELNAQSYAFARFRNNIIFTIIASVILAAILKKKNNTFEAESANNPDNKIDS